MATYYTTSRPRVPTSSSQPQHTRDDHTEQLATLEVADRSIYIFPTPSSLPASPGGSSIYSVPSDFTDFSNSDVRSTISSGASICTTRSPLGRTSQAHTRWRVSSNTATSAVSDLDVEVWDWAAESQDGYSSQEVNRDFEDEVKRTRGVKPRLPPEDTRVRAQSSLPFPPTNDFIDQHYRAFLRSRTQSDITMPSTYSVYTPQPRLHIPLLSFFASLLFLDLDEPALRLLTQSSPDSILFPGQPNTLGLISNDFAEVPDDDRSSLRSSLLFANQGSISEPHGLSRLLVDTAHRPVAVVRNGLAVICDPLIPFASPFVAPGISTIRNLGKLLGNAWSQGGRAWREAHLGH